jgi:hypothetical protein
MHGGVSWGLLLGGAGAVLLGRYREDGAGKGELCASAVAVTVTEALQRNAAGDALGHSTEHTGIVSCRASQRIPRLRGSCRRSEGELLSALEGKEEMFESSEFSV